MKWCGFYKQTKVFEQQSTFVQKKIARKMLMKLTPEVTFNFRNLSFISVQKLRRAVNNKGNYFHIQLFI